ncbi:MAG: hypothetical protein JSU92_14610 [Deltaproteobacteria bacterium]|nr:MAG: hypothetical protein JSU92_14610 [Deltaproteobacteria bacterium]
MVELSKSEEELINWARTQVKEPWLGIFRVAEKITRGSILTPEESEVAIPLSPFRADYRQLYFLFRELLPVFVFQPANLFIIVLDSEGKRIIRAYLQETRYSNFVSLKNIELSGQWGEKAEGFIAADDPRPLRDYLSDCFRDQAGEINWVMIANIRLFKVLKEILDGLESNGGLSDYLVNVYLALKKIYANGWISFSPTPNILARLEDIFRKDMIEYRSSDLFPQSYEPVSKSDIFVIVLRGRDFTVALRLDPRDPGNLTVDKEVYDRLDRIPFRKLAKAAARKTGAKMAIALSLDPVVNLLYELVSRPLPYGSDDQITILRKLLSLIKNFKRQWTICPSPIALKNYVRLPARLLGLPYDITNLADWFLPQVIVQGSGIALGQHFRTALIILEGTSVQAVIILEHYDGGLRKVKTFPVSELHPLFERTGPGYRSIREAVIKAKHLIWEKDGWISFAVSIQKNLLSELRSLLLGKKLTSLFRLPFAFPDLVRIFKLLRKGGMVVYPDISLREANKWVKKRGRFWVYSSLIQIPFTRKRPRTRGLLYVKSTIIAAVILGVIAGIILRLAAT